jgi:hypothetical protein
MKTPILCLLGFVAVATLPGSVEANAPSGRYIVEAGGTAQGTVYDSRTKLTWQQTVPSTTYAWADAKTYCSGVGTSLNLSGTGWRLPTVKELLSIVDYSSSLSPMIDPIVFPSTAAARFWSLSQTPSDPYYPWVVDFSAGKLGWNNPSLVTNYVRCVR